MTHFKKKGTKRDQKMQDITIKGTNGTKNNSKEQ